MIKVGLTGGIGSGKSTVCNFFRLLGIPVFEADYEAKKIVDKSAIIRSKLILNFGEDIYLPNQTLNRKKLSDIVFNSPSSLEKLNGIIHPEVRRFFFEWVQNQKTPYIVHEAAILFESGFYEMMDYRILVTAPEALRIERVMKRDEVSEEDVKLRMDKQWDDARKIELSDFVIYNDNTRLILPQLLELDKKLRSNG